MDVDDSNEAVDAQQPPTGEGSSSVEGTPSLKHKEPKKRFEVKKVGFMNALFEDISSEYVCEPIQHTHKHF